MYSLRINNLTITIFDLYLYFFDDLTTNIKILLMTLLFFLKFKISDKSSQQRCSAKKGVLKNFAKFTGKHLRQSLFFNKVAGAAWKFIKKDSGTGVFL